MTVGSAPTCLGFRRAKSPADAEIASSEGGEGAAQSSEAEAEIAERSEETGKIQR